MASRSLAILWSSRPILVSSSSSRPSSSAWLTQILRTQSTAFLRSASGRVRNAWNASLRPHDGVVGRREDAEISRRAAWACRSSGQPRFPSGRGPAGRRCGSDLRSFAWLAPSAVGYPLSVAVARCGQISSVRFEFASDSDSHDQSRARLRALRRRPGRRRRRCRPGRSPRRRSAAFRSRA